MRRCSLAFGVAAFLAASASLAQPADPPPDQPPPPDRPAAEPPAAAAQPAEPPPVLQKPPGGAAAGQPAVGPADAAGAAPDPDAPSLVFRGLLTPGVFLRGRPEALPRDRVNLEFFGGALVQLAARPFRMWSASLEVSFAPTRIDPAPVTDIVNIDADGDGDYDRQAVIRDPIDIPGARVHNAHVSFEPWDFLSMRGGVMYIPFTAAQQSPNGALMFPNRAAPNDVFIQGSDIGALLQSTFFEGRLAGSFGVFNGHSLGLQLQSTEAKGAVYSLRADVNPFGDFPFLEADLGRTGFRLGAGFGLLYRPETLYDEATGYQVATADDVRIAASLRMKYAGLYVGVEYLHRQQTDSVTSRPTIADGAYVQGSFLWHVRPSFAIGPIARLGVTATDVAVEPITVGWTDLGIACYPRADLPNPADLKITLNYVGERRFTEGEDAHGAAFQVQLGF